MMRVSTVYEVDLVKGAIKPVSLGVLEGCCQGGTEFVGGTLFADKNSAEKYAALLINERVPKELELNGYRVNKMGDGRHATVLTDGAIISVIIWSKDVYFYD